MAFMRYQPQSRVSVSPEWLAKGLKFAYIPGVAFINLVDGKGDIQHSGPATLGVSTSGRSWEPGSRAEFPVTVDANKGLTIVSVWRSRTGSDYTSADSTPALLSTRTSGNQGWTYGHTVATGGASNGNLVGQSITFQGVQQYTESTNAIESRIDTPVGFRYTKQGTKASWFRFGQKSSADQTIGTPSVGGNLIFGAQGEYASNGTPWKDRIMVCLVFEASLTDSDIQALTSSANAPYQVFIDNVDDEDAVVATTGGTTDTGSVSWAEDSDASSLISLVTNRSSITWVESGDAYSLVTLITDRAIISYQDDNDIYAIGSSVSGGPSTMAWTETNDAYAMQVFVTDTASLAWTEVDDTHPISARLYDSLNAVWSESDDSVLITGMSTDFGTLSWTEPNDGILFLPSNSANGSMRRRKGIHK